MQLLKATAAVTAAATLLAGCGENSRLPVAGNDVNAYLSDCASEHLGANVRVIYQQTGVPFDQAVSVLGAPTAETGGGMTITDQQGNVLHRTVVNAHKGLWLSGLTTSPLPQVETERHNLALLRCFGPLYRDHILSMQ